MGIPKHSTKEATMFYKSAQSRTGSFLKDFYWHVLALEDEEDAGGDGGGKGEDEDEPEPGGGTGLHRSA